MYDDQKNTKGTKRTFVPKDNLFDEGFARRPKHAGKLKHFIDEELELLEEEENDYDDVPSPVSGKSTP